MMHLSVPLILEAVCLCDKTLVSDHFLYYAPSKSSRLAPPPVLTWLTFSAAPNCAAAVAVSPPPMGVHHTQ